MDRNELIISIIKDDLIYNKLLHGLIDIGLNPKDYYLHLGEILFKLIGLEGSAITDETYSHYLTLVQRAKYLNIKNSNDHLTKVAEEIYAELLIIKTSAYEKK